MTLILNFPLLTVSTTTTEAGIGVTLIYAVKESEEVNINIGTNEVEWAIKNNLDVVTITLNAVSSEESGKEFVSALNFNQNVTSVPDEIPCMNTIEVEILEVTFIDGSTGTPFECDAKNQSFAEPPYIQFDDPRNVSRRFCFVNKTEKIYSFGDQITIDLVIGSLTNIIPTIRLVQRVASDVCCGGVFYQRQGEVVPFLNTVVTSPDYPTLYPNLARCPYVFRCIPEVSGEDCAVRVSILDFRLENANLNEFNKFKKDKSDDGSDARSIVGSSKKPRNWKKCRGLDALTVSTKQNIWKSDVFCREKEPSKTYTATNEVILYLETNSENQDNGFAVTFNALDPTFNFYTENELENTCNCGTGAPLPIIQDMKNNIKDKKEKDKNYEENTVKAKSLRKMKKIKNGSLSHNVYKRNKVEKQEKNEKVRKRQKRTTLKKGIEDIQEEKGEYGNKRSKNGMPENKTMKIKNNDKEKPKNKKMSNNDNEKHKTKQIDNKNNKKPKNKRIKNKDNEKPKNKKIKKGKGKKIKNKGRKPGKKLNKEKGNIENEDTKTDETVIKTENTEKINKKGLLKIKRKNKTQDKVERVANGLKATAPKGHPWLHDFIQVRLEKKKSKTEKGTKKVRNADGTTGDGREVSRQCLATLLNDRFLITTTQCCTYCTVIYENSVNPKAKPWRVNPSKFEDPTVNDIAVILGLKNFKVDKLEKYDLLVIKKVLINDVCLNTLNNPPDGVSPDDLYPVICPVLLMTKKKVTNTKFIKPICLPLYETVSTVGKNAYSVGRGWQDLSSGAHSQKMKALVKPKIKKDKKCQKRLGKVLIDDTLLCSTGGKKKGNMCIGDEGAPLIDVTLKGSGFKQYTTAVALLGIPGCKNIKNSNKNPLWKGAEGQPEVFNPIVTNQKSVDVWVDLRHYVTWIMQAFQDNLQDPVCDRKPATATAPNVTLRYSALDEF